MLYLCCKLVPQTYLAYFFFLNPQSKRKGSGTAVYAALSEDMEGVGGCYLDNCDSIASSSVSYDRKLQTALWHVSCDWCHLPKDILSHRTLKEISSQDPNGKRRVSSH